MREGWKIKKLKEVCDKITDGTHQTPKYFDEGVIFLSSKNVTSGKIDWENIKYIDEAQHFQLHKRVAPKVGDILLAKNGTTGVAAMVDRDVVFDIYVSLAHIRVLNEITPEYMLYFINSPLAKNQFNSRLKGVGVPNLHLKEIREVEIPFPKSIEEQKQIVAILDKAFAAIDQAKANIEKNIENAKELFQSKLNGIFSQKGDGWEKMRFKEVCVLQRGFDLPKRLRKKGKYDLVTSSGIKDSHSEYKVAGPGVVTGRSGSIGNVFYIENKFWPLNTALYIKDFKKNNEKYVYYFLKNFDLSKYSTGTGVPTLNRNFVHDESVLSTNNVDEQIALVQTLDYITIKSEEIEILYRNKLSELEDLKKSILQKAFTGELTKEFSVRNEQLAVNT